MNHQIKSEKSLDLCVSLRESGNKLFSLKDYSSCIEVYTKSILSCPNENVKELGLAFANRSAALFELHLYEDCIEDIDTAISKHYPSHLLPKILLRKVKALKKLGLTEGYNKTLTEIEAAIKVMEISDKGIFTISIS